MNYNYSNYFIGYRKPVISRFYRRLLQISRRIYIKERQYYTRMDYENVYI
jgi:hypothetical protein